MSVVFSELIVEQDLKHSLPIELLKSRLATALVFSLFDRRKQVLKLLLTISKSSRTFIITQEGLPGFLLTFHDNIGSWLNELKVSESYKLETGFPLDANIDNLSTELKGISEIDTHLRINNPRVYVSYLKAFGRTQ